jgi:type IV secretory pathway VirB10-like protein
MAFRLPGRSHPSTIRPLEIGRRLLRAIDDNVDIDIKGRRVSPDTFTVSLSETDRAALADDEKALIEELAAAATSYIRDEGLNILAAVNVTFSTEKSLDIGKIAIATAISGQQSEDIPQEPVAQPEQQVHVPAVPEPAPIQPGIDHEPTPAPPAAPEPVEPDVPPAAPVDLPPPVVTPAPEPLTITGAPEPTAARAAFGAIVQRDGTRHPVGNTPLTMGRATSNGIQISDGQASRQHAEIRYENGRHHVVDLNSTNGTLVNDQRITGSQQLNHGDIITIGATEFRYESS